MNFKKNCAQLAQPNFLGPGRQRFAAHFAKQSAFGERPVHQHGKLLVRGERQEPFLGVALGQGNN